MSAVSFTPRRAWKALLLATATAVVGYFLISNTDVRPEFFALMGIVSGTLILITLRRSRLNEERVQDLMDHASDAIFIVADHRFVDVNGAACTMTGCSREELLDMKVASSDPFDQLGLLDELFAKLKAGETVIAERELVRRDGSQITIEAHARRLPDGRFQAIARDISARVEAERALRESDELLRHAFDSGASGMALGTLDGRFIRVNQAFASMLGYEPQDLAGVDTTAVTAPDDRNALVEPLDRMARGDLAKFHADKRFLHRDGHEVWTRVDLALTRDADGEPRMVVAHILDTSRSRELESRLRQAEKMEAIGRLAGGVAHDFNNLLGVVLNYSAFVAEELGSDHACTADVREIIKAGRRGAALTRQLLTFSRLDVPRTEVLLVNDAVLELEPLLRKLIPENIELSVQLNPDIPEVAMDHTHLDQILVNLAVNAKDAMLGDGELKISTSHLTLRDASEDLGLGPGRYAIASVSDTGTGIPDEIRDHVFEPFFTTKDRHKGTGFGLATVHGIVSQAGGAVHIESREGHGTRFDVFLPATLGAAGFEPSSLPSIDITSDADSLDLLVVEDEPSVRAVTSRILRAAGHHVVEATDGIEALDLLREETFDVLVSDIVMPWMSGLELRKRVDLPAVLISGYPDDVIRDHGELPSDTALVMKPFTPMQLAHAVTRAAARSAV